MKISGLMCNICTGFGVGGELQDLFSRASSLLPPARSTYRTRAVFGVSISLAQGFVHGLVHLVLSPEVILHELFAYEGFFADGADARTIFLKMNGREMSLSVPQPGKGTTAQTALATTIVESNNPSLGDLCNGKRKAYFFFSFTS